MPDEPNTIGSEQAQPQTPAKGRAQRRQFAAMERRKKALEMRMAGLTYQQIADNLGYGNRNSAYDAVDSALRDIPRENAVKLRTLELERLDFAASRIAKRVSQGDLPAIDRWLKIQERRARLQGLDAPTRIQNDLTSGGEKIKFVPVTVDPKKVTGEG